LPPDGSNVDYREAIGAYAGWIDLPTELAPETPTFRIRHSGRARCHGRPDCLLIVSDDQPGACGQIPPMVGKDCPADLRYGARLRRRRQDKPVGRGGDAVEVRVR
jgi:hypothetical protein